MLLLFANISVADEYPHEQLCLQDLEAKKLLFSFSEEQLKASKEEIKAIETLDEYSELVGADYSEVVKTIKFYRKVDLTEAREIVLKMYKDIELSRVDRTLYLKNNPTEKMWEFELSSCINESKKMILENN